MYTIFHHYHYYLGLVVVGSIISIIISINCNFIYIYIRTYMICIVPCSGPFHLYCLFLSPSSIISQAKCISQSVFLLPTSSSLRPLSPHHPIVGHHLVPLPVCLSTLSIHPIYLLLSSLIIKRSICPFPTISMYQLIIIPACVRSVKSAKGLPVSWRIRVRPWKEPGIALLRCMHVCIEEGEGKGRRTSCWWWMMMDGDILMYGGFSLPLFVCIQRPPSLPLLHTTHLKNQFPATCHHLFLLGIGEWRQFETEQTYC